MTNREKAILTLTPLLLFFTLYQLPDFGDYTHIYHAVGTTPLNPYQHHGFLNPPWAAWLLAPLSVLPTHAAGALMMTAALFVVVWTMHQMDAPLLAIVLCLTSPAAIRYLTSGQIDFIVLSGFMLLKRENSWGYPLMSLKPQVLGLGALTHWLHDEQRIRAALPFATVLLSSFAIYGAWPLAIEPAGLETAVDFSMWPWGLLPGVPVAAWAIWTNRPTVAALATYLLVPYVSPSSLFVYTAVLFSHVPRPVSALVWLFMWTFAIWFT